MNVTVDLAYPAYLFLGRIRPRHQPLPPIAGPRQQLLLEIMVSELVIFEFLTILRF